MVKNRIFRNFEYPNDIDVEMVPLLNMLNSIPGVRTEYCCSGHGYGDWYLVIRFTSDYAMQVIGQLFVHRSLNGQFDFSNTLRFKYEMYAGEENAIMCNVPETSISVYCKEFDTHTVKERFDEYSRICKFLSNLLVRKYW